MACFDGFVCVVGIEMCGKADEDNKIKGASRQKKQASRESKEVAEKQQSSKEKKSKCVKKAHS
jgi:hypothetical protein